MTPLSTLQSPSLKRYKTDLDEIGFDWVAVGRRLAVTVSDGNSQIDSSDGFECLIVNELV